MRARVIPRSIVLLALLAGIAAAPAGAAPQCITPRSPDRAEPPCNPYLGSTVWSTNHRLPYAQASSPFPAPRPGQDVRYEHRSLLSQIPVILQVSDPYPDGRRALWFSTVSVPEQRAVYKLDYETLEPIDSADASSEGGADAQLLPSTSGVYNLLTYRNQLVVVRERALAVYGDAEPGRLDSPIELVRRFELPARGFCRSSDRLIGIQLLYSGELAYATVQGMVGVLPSAPARMRQNALRTLSLNGDACADPGVEDAALEEVNNSIAADERGGIYVVSTRAMYKLRWRDGRLRLAWRTPYETGGGVSGSTLSAGSGSTPTLMGIPGDRDKFVVITDGQQVMHLVLFWRNRVPRDWEPIAPGKPRRIACEYPVTFGDPAATTSKSEQSVLVRGYASVVPNNALALDAAFSLLPANPPLRPISALTGNLPGNGPKGLERIDWDPQSRRCSSVWANPEVSIPNAVPTMSARSGLVYGIGVRDLAWGLEGVDFETGEQKLWVPASPLPTDNSFFGATTIGAGGAVLSGTVGGVTAFR